MQSQESLEKSFFEQIRPGDYVDAKDPDDKWRLAQVIDRDNRFLSLIFDGSPPGDDVLNF